MEFILIDPKDDLSEAVQVLNVSHGTVAEEFGFTKENNPTNNAFIDETTLKEQLYKGITLFGLYVDRAIVGCIAIEKSEKEKDTFYIEKVSVRPEFRHQHYGIGLMNYATQKIKELGGKVISIALIDSNHKLKRWYLSQGFTEKGFKDFEHLPFRVCFMQKHI
jgi:diamine N-acetyltransferase